MRTFGGKLNVFWKCFLPDSAEKQTPLPVLRKRPQKVGVFDAFPKPDGVFSAACLPRPPQAEGPGGGEAVSPPAEPNVPCWG